jgi:hypothetical protein
MRAPKALAGFNAAIPNIDALKALTAVKTIIDNLKGA